jgi:hypothetical protein
MTYHEIDNGIGSSLHSVILWQYENAEKLKAFIESMCEAAYLAVDDFWDKWATLRTNVNLAASKVNATFSLSVIGATCGIPRPDNISDAMYAKLIKCRMKLSMTTSVASSDYYEYIKELFNSRIVLEENPNDVVMSVGFEESEEKPFDYTNWSFRGDLIDGATYSISSSGSGSSVLFSLHETIDGETQTISNFTGNEFSSRILFEFSRVVDDETVEASIIAETSTADESILYHSEDSNDYGLYWLILPTGVKRGISNWSGNTFGLVRNTTGTPPQIGFGTESFPSRFMTSYQFFQQVESQRRSLP